MEDGPVEAVRELATVVDDAVARADVGLIPNTLCATVLSVHPT
jgi:hypothetical protein